MRIAFNSIYFTRGFSLKSLISFLRSISILLLVGLPFVFINILITCVKVRGLSGLWDELSPFKNLKLLVRDGKIIRNMKKSLVDGGRVYSEIKNCGGLIKQGLLPLSKGVAHAVSYRKSVGVTYTTKNQGRDEDLIARDDISFIYAQGFGNNEIIPKDEIKNKGLMDLLDKRGIVDAVYANLHVLKIPNAQIIFNDKGKQFLRKLEFNEIRESEKFLIECGGIDKVKKAFEYSENINGILISAKKMLYMLSNSSHSSMHEVYMKYKETHEILIELEKENHLKPNSELLKIKNKIDGILEGFM